MQVGHADRVDGGLVAELVGGAVDVARLEAAAGEEQSECVAVVVAAVGVLRDRQAAELAGPDRRSSRPAGRGRFRSVIRAAAGRSVWPQIDSSSVFRLL